MKRHISIKEVEQINHLYWDESAQQADIAQDYGMSDTGHISRLVNGKRQSIQVVRQAKYSAFLRRVVAPSQEAPQATILRAKRENLHSTKLTWKKAQEIRREYYLSTTTQVELAKRYGVSQGTIAKLVNGLTWKKSR